MSLKAITAYVNQLITANREQDPENISVYFKLMEETATRMLSQLDKAHRLLGLEKICDSLLNKEEKMVIRQAVDYIISHSDDLARDLDLMSTMGLLDLDTQLPGGRYEIRYNLEAIFRRASDLKNDQASFWESIKMAFRPRQYFIEAFEKASEWKPEVGTLTNLTDGLKLAR